MKRSVFTLGLITAAVLSLSPAALADGKPALPQSTTAGTAKTASITSTLWTGRFTLPEKGDPVEMCYQLFELNKDQFRVNNPREELVFVKKRVGRAGTTHVTFKQLVNGVDIVHSAIKVHFGRDGEFSDMTGTFWHDIDINTTPRIDSLAAESSALKELELGEFGRVFKSDDYHTYLSLWHPDQGNYYLIWKVYTYNSKNWRSWETYVNALDGKVLHRMGMEQELQSQARRPTLPQRGTL